MANRYRAEATIVLGGKPYLVALTTGATVQLADALGVETFGELGERLSAMKIRDIPLVIAALLRGNGHEVDEAAIAAMNFHPDYADLLNALMAGPPKGGEENPPKAPAKLPSTRTSPAR